MDTFTLVHTVPLSTVGTFGDAKPDHLQLPPANASDHELSMPTSAAARSCTLSVQIPATFWPLNAVIGRLVMIRLSAVPPWRLLTMNDVPAGEIRVTTRSPMNVCVMLSDSDSDVKVPLLVTEFTEAIPVELLFGYDFCTCVE